MKFNTTALLLSAAAATAVVAQPSVDTGAKAFNNILASNPIVSSAFNDVLTRHANGLSDRLNKRACGGLDPCCDFKTGCESRDTCYGHCAGSGAGAGGAGCVLSCLTACPAHK
ncbi:hypothetical protein EJ02DRAFT_514231 [Clathrospora elynae]|uniref:Uncharacterized protein n=1 Tax=Clathrospora elynae TaxID=706981 RepID=A0A6A5SGM9_9PLEO|nr:hypothetical protein EJ02DRAFT_514231 [Clathrospora elynae]